MNTVINDTPLAIYLDFLKKVSPERATQAFIVRAFEERGERVSAALVCFWKSGERVPSAFHQDILDQISGGHCTPKQWHEWEVKKVRAERASA